MSDEVTSVDNTPKVDPASRTEQRPQLGSADRAQITEATNRVDPNQVAQRLGAADTDGFERAQSERGAELRDEGRRADAARGDPNLVLASTGSSTSALSLNLPMSLLGSTSSPVDSSRVVQRMGELGALGNGDAARFDRSRFDGLVSNDPAAPFTGQGATGVRGPQGSIPVSDLAALARYNQAEQDLRNLREQRTKLEDAKADTSQNLPPAIEARRQELLDHQLSRNKGLIDMSKGVLNALEPTVSSYRNPLSDGFNVSGDPKVHFDAATREQQAKLFLQQPISTIHGNAYGDRLPTREETIRAAADKYNLDPAVLSGVMLHEQRDQSKNEDVADYGGATLAGRDTSLGLGQILMSTAMKNNKDLLSDTVDAQTRASMSRSDVAKLLTSDEHNIYATARYLRQVADQGAAVGADPDALPNTRRDYPGLDPAQYRGRNWGDDNIRAIASEYTSKPWDDNTIPPTGYPQYVLDAVEDIRRTGIFGR